MDLTFEAQETAAYENWLETPAGQRYLQASQQLLDKVLDWRPGWRVLDVGCGLGVHLKVLQDRGMHVYGLESGPVAARLAASRLGEKGEVEVGDAHDLPYEDNSFDAVILVNTLELVDRRAQVLAEASRVAASRLCVVTRNPLGLSSLLARRPGGGHPLFRGGSLGLWSLLRLVREVLGPVPQRWCGAVSWPVRMAGHWPFASLVGVCAAVTPRLMTTPLVVKAAGRPRSAAPAHMRGRVSALHRVK